MKVIDPVTGFRTLMGHRALLEDDAPGEPGLKETIALRSVLADIVQKIADGDLAGDQAVSAILDAVDDPDAAATALQESEHTARRRDQDARERSARELLESLAKPAAVRVTRDHVLKVARGRTESSRRTVARELIEAERKRLARLRKPTRSVVDAVEGMAVLQG